VIQHINQVVSETNNRKTILILVPIKRIAGFGS